MKPASVKLFLLVVSVFSVMICCTPKGKEPKSPEQPDASYMQPDGTLIILMHRKSVPPEPGFYYIGGFHGSSSHPWTIWKKPKD